MTKISIVIITHNEEKNILDCIESVMDLGEIIIIDDFSEDRTYEVVKSLKNSNIRLYKRKLSGNFAEQRNYGLKKAAGDWVLFLDADERITSELKSEILSKILISSSSTNGFFIKRSDFMWGKQLKHGEIGNLKILRLARKESGIWAGRVHEEWRINGKSETLISPINHYPHSTISEFLSEINFYSTIRADELYDQKTKVSVLDIIIYPKIKFFVNYFSKFGFLDGISGFVFAAMMSFHSFLVRSKLWLLINKAS